MAMLDATVANLALETIRIDFGASLSAVQWVATAYLIALAVSLPLTGWLTRRFGDGRIWASGMILFVAGSLACGFAQSLEQLILARCLQGVAAGVLVPAGQAILAVSADKRQFGRLMGTVGFAVALGPALGPGFGGVLIDAVSWRWLFWVNAPVGGIALLAATRLIRRGAVSSAARLDLKGFTMISAGLPLLLYGAAGLASAGVALEPIASLMAGAILTAAFLRHALTVPAPLIEIRLLRRTPFTAAVSAAALAGAAMYGGLLLLPLYLQDMMDLPPSQAGFMLLLMGLGSACGLPLAGHFTDRHGPKAVCLAGSALLLFGTFPFIAISLPLGLTAMLLVLRGGGLALAQMPAMTSAYTTVDKHETGDAAVVVNVTQRVGGALGAITMAVILQQAFTPANGTAYGIAFAVLAVFAIGGLVAGAQLPDSRQSSDAVR
jgi:EmrB/QacA subfamily drug resistance transporter